MILTTQAKNAMLQGLADELNKSSSNATLFIYADDDVVVEFAMPKPIQDSITNGKLVFDLPEQVLATKSATPTTAKLVNGEGVEVATFAINTELVLDAEGVYKGGYVNITGLTIQI